MLRDVLSCILVGTVSVLFVIVYLSACTYMLNISASDNNVGFISK